IPICDWVCSVALNGLDRMPKRIHYRARRRIPVILIPRRGVMMRAASVVVSVIGVGFPGGRGKPFRISQVTRHTEDDSLLGAVGIDRANNVPPRVIVHDYLLPPLDISRRCIVPSSGEERLVLLYHPSLVVVDLPPTDHDVRRVLGCTLSAD